MTENSLEQGQVAAADIALSSPELDSRLDAMLADMDAEDAAVEETKQLSDGAERLKLIDLVLWKRTHTLQGAAMVVYVSERTAQEWHRQFIYLVAEKRGLYSKVCVREP